MKYKFDRQDPIQMLREKLGLSEDQKLLPVWELANDGVVVSAWRSPGGRVFLLVEYKHADAWNAYVPIGLANPLDKIDRLAQFLAHPSICTEAKKHGDCNFCEYAPWNSEGLPEFACGHAEAKP